MHVGVGGAGFCASHGKLSHIYYHIFWKPSRVYLVISDSSVIKQKICDSAGLWLPCFPAHVIGLLELCSMSALWFLYTVVCLICSRVFEFLSFVFSAGGGLHSICVYWYMGSVSCGRWVTTERCRITDTYHCLGYLCHFLNAHVCVCVCVCVCRVCVCSSLPGCGIRDTAGTITLIR